MVCILGIESSANKIGVGIIRDGQTLSNPRRTYNAPIGEGFRPTETAEHHRRVCAEVVEEAIQQAGIKVGFRCQFVINLVVGCCERN